MSLVNDMLRDLDQRKQFSGKNGRISALIGSGLDESQPRAPGLPLLVAISVLIGMTVGYFLFGRDQDAPVLQAPRAVSEIAAEPVANTLQAPALVSRLEITDVTKTDETFTLRLRGSSELSYVITDRNSQAIALKFNDVKTYDNGGRKVEGLSVIQMPDHTVLELMLEREADIELYSDTAAAAGTIELVLAATYRKPAAEPAPAVAQAVTAPLQLGSVPADYLADTGRTALPVAAPSPLSTPVAAEPLRLAAAPQPAPTTSSVRSLDPGALPLRVTRGLTVEQQDRNTSQAAVTLMQSGRLLEAYEKLLTFLARNPEAHVSRETLGTILLAQREFAQANIVVDEGLRLASNYAPYKKIKARLLLQEGRAAEALQLLQMVPPSLQVDQEYYELLATLYQQSGDHARAISTYQELLRSNNAEGRWWTGMGISLEAQGETSKALSSYQAALQQSSLDSSVRQYSQNRVRTLSEQ